MPKHMVIGKQRYVWS